MISITKTVYPRFKRVYEEEEIEKIFRPSDQELQFVHKKVKGEASKLTLLTLLKCQQHLGYLPAIKIIPKTIRQYLATQLGCSSDLELIEQMESSKTTFHRYRKLIRHRLGIFPWSEEANAIVYATVKKSALSMSNPPDLMNVAIEKLIEQRYELPAFSTLDRLVSHVRHQVHLELYGHFCS